MLFAQIDYDEMVIPLKYTNPTFPQSFHGALQFQNTFAQIHSQNQVSAKPALLK